MGSANVQIKGLRYPSFYIFEGERSPRDGKSSLIPP